MVMRGAADDTPEVLGRVRRLSKDGSGEAAVIVADDLKHGDVVAVVRGEDGCAQVLPFGAADAQTLRAVGVLTAGSGAHAGQDIVCRLGVVKVSVRGPVRPGATLYATQGPAAVAAPTAPGAGLRLGVALAPSQPDARPDQVHSVLSLVAVSGGMQLPQDQRDLLLARARIEIARGHVEQLAEFRHVHLSSSKEDLVSLDESAVFFSTPDGTLDAPEGHTRVVRTTGVGSSMWFILHCSDGDGEGEGADRSVVVQSALDDSRWLSAGDDGAVVVVDEPSSSSSQWQLDPRPDGTVRLVGECGAVGFDESGSAILTEHGANFRLHQRR